MECSRIPPAVLWGEDSGMRDLYRQHLRSCLACRRRVLAQAPEELLFDLSGESLPDEFWTGFWESLEKKLPEREAAPVIVPAYRFTRWAAVFVVGLLLALFSRTLPPAAPAPQRTEARWRIKSEELPLIEDVQNPKATYYIIQSGEKEKIVMLYDPDMEL